jgi:hypothetical protein
VAIKQIMEAKFGKPVKLDPRDPALIYAQDPNIVALQMVGNEKWAQGKAGIALAVLPRPTKGMRPGLAH